MTATIVIAAMIALYALSDFILNGGGSCLECGWRGVHAPDCRSQKGKE